jgi:IS5 family transposase
MLSGRSSPRDNAKKVNGRKRHIAVDAAGLLLAVVITAASVQDRDAARPLLWNLHRSRENIFSDTQPPPPRRNKPGRT